MDARASAVRPAHKVSVLDKAGLVELAKALGSQGGVRADRGGGGVAEPRARARGVRPLARVLGWGSTQDAYRVTAPRPDGAAAQAAISRALARAGLCGGEVGYVNAHGTGTPLNDPSEARAIRGAIGECAAVSSIKGALGHLMAASGALEVAACLLPFERDVLPGTAHLVERDPER